MIWYSILLITLAIVTFISLLFYALPPILPLFHTSPPILPLFVDINDNAKLVDIIDNINTIQITFHDLDSVGDNVTGGNLVGDNLGDNLVGDNLGGNFRGNVGGHLGGNLPGADLLGRGGLSGLGGLPGADVLGGELGSNLVGLNLRGADVLGCGGLGGNFLAGGADVLGDELGGSQSIRYVLGGADLVGSPGSSKGGRYVLGGVDNNLSFVGDNLFGGVLDDNVLGGGNFSCGNYLAGELNDDVVDNNFASNLFDINGNGIADDNLSDYSNDVDDFTMIDDANMVGSAIDNNQFDRNVTVIVVKNDNNDSETGHSNLLFNQTFNSSFVKSQV